MGQTKLATFVEEDRCGATVNSGPGAPDGYLVRKAKRLLWDTWLFPRYLDSVYIRQGLRDAQKYAGGRLLDVGCGRRRYEALFIGTVQYVGMDWPTVAERARADVLGDALHIPFGSRAFDTVLATELMEHLSDPHRFLDEVSRVLKPGGSLIFSVPLMEGLHEAPRDYYRFTPFGLHALLNQHHFTMRELWRRGGWWSLVVGSLVAQGLYDCLNPPDAFGTRRNRTVAVVALPFCALAQLVGYGLDRVFKSRRHTLGYVVVATSDAEPRHGGVSKMDSALPMTFPNMQPTR